MKKRFTSASANKQIKAYEEEKEHVLANERDVSTYVLSAGEAVEPPEYDYGAARAKVAELDGKVRALRCALHAFNVGTVLPESGITIDEALVFMAQLNGEKKRLSELRSNQSKQRVASRYFGSGNAVEYRYANYDIGCAERDFQEVSERIRQLQMEVDYANQTIAFEVDV